MLPLPINSNPGWVFPKQNFNNQVEEMLKFVTKLILGLINFKQNLETGQLPEELAPGRSGQPKMQLCMKQYERLLNAYRKPGEGQDFLICSDAKTPRKDEHLVILAYNHLYKMPIKAEGQWLSFSQILQQLADVQKEAVNGRNIPLNERVPLLTSSSRETWCTSRQKLMEAGNEKILQEIETCLFIVCLDPVTQNLSGLFLMQFLEG